MRTSSPASSAIHPSRRMDVRMASAVPLVLCPPFDSPPSARRTGRPCKVPRGNADLL